MNPVIKTLRRHPLFEGLRFGAFNALVNQCSLLEAPKGTVIYRDGDPADAVYVVVSGRLRALVENPRERDRVIAFYGPESTFGERALLTGDTHRTTVKVTTDAVLAVLPAAAVQRAVDSSPVFARAIAGRVGTHLRRMHKITHAGLGGRIATIASISPVEAIRALVTRIATDLVRETGSEVLLVEAVLGAGRPALAEFDRSSFSPGRLSEWVEKGFAGVPQLCRIVLHFDGGAEDATRVAPLLAHMAGRYPYVLVLADTLRNEPAVLEFLLQCDEAYMLLRQDDQEILQSRHLIAALRDDHGRGHHAEIRPVLCVEKGVSTLSFPELRDRLSLPVYRVLHEVPGPNEALKETLPESERLLRQLRYLAREIGHCRIGLALSAGGARGLAHVGVIQVLEEHGIDIDVVAGTSMGALVAALWAAGKTGVEMEEIARRLERPGALLKMIDPVFPPRTGFMKGGFIEKLMKKELGLIQFSDLLRQLRLVATDIETLERVVIDHGEVWAAVMASTSVPAVIVPFHYLNRKLVDGGISDPMPVDVLQEIGVEKIIAVNVIPNPEDLRSCMLDGRAGSDTSSTTFGKRFPRLNRHINYFARGNILDIIMKSVHGAGCRLAEESCRRADIVLKPMLCDGSFHEFHRPGRYIQCGRTVTEEQLDEVVALTRPGHPEVVKEKNIVNTR